MLRGGRPGSSGGNPSWHFRNRRSPATLSRSPKQTLAPLSRHCCTRLAPIPWAPPIRSISMVSGDGRVQGHTSDENHLLLKGFRRDLRDVLRHEVGKVGENRITGKSRGSGSMWSVQWETSSKGRNSRVVWDGRGLYIVWARGTVQLKTPLGLRPRPGRDGMASWPWQDNACGPRYLSRPLCNKDPSRGEGQINDIRDVQTSKETRRATRLPYAIGSRRCGGAMTPCR